MESPIQDRNIDTLVTVAQLYYIENRPQSEIAEILHLSRPTISRMLKKAVDSGLVSIRINDTSYDLLKLAGNVQARYHLHKVIVVKSNEANLDSVISEAAFCASEYISTLIHDGDLIGMSHGTTVYHLLEYLHPIVSVSADVIQLQGNSTLNLPYVQGSYIAQELARILGGTAYTMPIPISVQSKLLHDLLLEESYVQEHFRMFSKLKLALVGIGTDSFDYELQSMRLLLENEANGTIVGNICSHFFDKDGVVVDSAYQEHCIGIPFEDLRRVPEVVGIAVGSKKQAAVKAALGTGIIKSLVTDERIATFLLQQ